MIWKTTQTCLLAAACTTALGAQGATVSHYWNFDNIDDSVGGLTGANVTGSNYALGATYGSAYAGSGNAMETQLSGTGFEVALAGELDMPGDWSVSFWAYNDNASDGDSRGMRVYDTLAGTSSGIQLGSNLAGLFNARFDDENNVAVITNNVGAAPAAVENRWSHVVINYTAGGTVDIYFDGALVDSDSVAGLSGPLTATQALQIGSINGGGSAGASQQGALDDLAFYDGTLSANEIAGLANGSLTPLNIPEPTSLALLGLGGLLVARRRRSA